MRTLLALALVLAACGPADRSPQSAAHDAPSATQARGPDPLVLRVARTGGRARVYAYPRLDSLVWSAPGAPRITEVLGFDPDQGVITFVDHRNVPGRIDLRLGDVATAGARFTLTGARAAEGSAVFGVADGKGVRSTPTGRWEFAPGRPLSTVFPQPDGSLIALSRRREGSAQLWRVFPPQTEVRDSGSVGNLADGLRFQAGDRLYLATPGGFAVIDSRSLRQEPPIVLPRRALDAASSPSGDRVFFVVENDTALAVYERYRGRLGRPAPLPGRARALRMDPLGRYLLVRPAAGDSVWIVALGTQQHVGTVRSEWRADLPFVAPDGAVATAQGKDVVFTDGATLRQTARVAGGASDHWYLFQWSGFRPRAEGLDQPVEFAFRDPESAADSAAAADDATSADSVATERASTPSTSQWIVSFAALLVEDRARSLAEEISIEGQHARVVASEVNGTPVHRVVLGPYGDRETAERIGRASGRPYWVYAASPQ